MIDASDSGSFLPYDDKHTPSLYDTLYYFPQAINKEVNVLPILTWSIITSPPRTAFKAFNLKFLVTVSPYTRRDSAKKDYSIKHENRKRIRNKAHVSVESIIS